MARKMSDRMLFEVVEAYYVDNETGGNLHVLLDEEGTSDRCVNMCILNVDAFGDLVGLAIATEFKEMTEDVRDIFFVVWGRRGAQRRSGVSDHLLPYLFDANNLR